MYDMIYKIGNSGEGRQVSNAYGVDWECRESRNGWARAGSI